MRLVAGGVLWTALVAAAAVDDETPPPRQVQLDPAAVPVLRADAVGYARHTLQFRFADQLQLAPVQVRTGMRAALPEPAIDTATSHMYLARLIEGTIAFDCSGAGPKVVEVVVSSGSQANAPTYSKRCNAEELVKLLGAIAYELRSPELAERFRTLLLTAAERQSGGSPPPAATVGAAATRPVAARAPVPVPVRTASATPAPAPAGPARALPAGNVHLSWEAPKRLSNGKRIRDRIARYRIHGSQSPEGAYRVLAEVPGDRTRTSLTLPSGPWYLAVTAVLPDGSESAYSAEVTKRVP